MGPPALVCLANEVAQHLLGDLEVIDHAVLERADGADRAGGAAQHALGLATHGVDFAGALVDGHHGRLGEHDAAAADIHQGVGGTQVDGDVARAEACKEVEETDELLLSVRVGRSCYTPFQAAPNRGAGHLLFARVNTVVSHRAVRRAGLHPGEPLVRWLIGVIWCPSRPPGRRR